VGLARAASRAPAVIAAGTKGTAEGGLTTEEWAQEERLCGAVNRYVQAVCKLGPGHSGDHVSGQYRWTQGGRPYQLEGDELALARAHLPPPSDAERLAELTQVLLTARSQMLGLGAGLKAALDQMPRAVDNHAVRGIVASLSHIVAGLSKHVVTEAESGIRKEARLGTDLITASTFESLPPRARERKRRELEDELAGADDEPLVLPPAASSSVLGESAEWRRKLGDARTPAEYEAQRQSGATFQAVLEDDERRLGRKLTDDENLVLVARVRGELGLGAGLSTTAHLREEQWAAIARTLEQVGLLLGPQHFHRPTLAGYRRAIVLLSIGNGQND
jgi:hypothetical protein